MQEQPINQGVADRRAIAANLFALLEADERVNFVLTVGSTARGTETELSDVDICIVMKDDNGLNQILREINIIFQKIGRLVNYYEYNPYHFYVIYEGSIPLDIYIISSSVYYIVRKADNRVVVDHSKKTSEDCSVSSGTDDIQVIIEKLFLKGWVRTFRLLSKIKKEEYVTLVYILNQIREDQLLPLLTMVGGYNIPHSKAVKLHDFESGVRDLFVKTFANPLRDSSLDAVKALADLLYILYIDAKKKYAFSADLDKLSGEVVRRIKGYE